MFYDTALFPFTALLEKNWRVIHAELDALDSAEFKDWPEHSIYGDRGAGRRSGSTRSASAAGGMRTLPADGQVVRQIPGMTMAGFPGWLRASTLPRIGATTAMRATCSASISAWKFLTAAPFGSGRKREAGRKARASCSTTPIEHEAWNQVTRAVPLLCDFLNPLRRRPLILNPQISPELDRIPRARVHSDPRARPAAVVAGVETGQSGARSPSAQAGKRSYPEYS